MEQRRRIRVTSRKSVTLVAPGATLSGEIVNISLKGCLIESVEGESPRKDQEVEVTIHLEPGDASLDVGVRGKVARVDEGAVAVDFTAVPAESFGHLFRLVQYNAPDPIEIEEELGRSAFESFRGR